MYVEFLAIGCWCGRRLQHGEEHALISSGELFFEFRVLRFRIVIDCRWRVGNAGGKRG
jgi:hypothetical protein